MLGLKEDFLQAFRKENLTDVFKPMFRERRRTETCHGVADSLICRL